MADLAVIIRDRCVVTDDHRHVFGVASDSCRFEISGHDLKRGGGCGRSLVGLGLFVVCANQTSYVIPTACAGSLDIV